MENANCGKIFPGRTAKIQKCPKIKGDSAGPVLAWPTLIKTYDYHTDAGGCADIRGDWLFAHLFAAGRRVWRGGIHFYHRQDAWKMNCARQSGCFPRRRFLEIWRSGRPDLQDSQIGVHERERGHLFGQEAVGGDSKFQVFRSKIRASSL